MRCEGFNTQYTLDGKTVYGCDTYFSVDKAFKNLWQRVDSLDFLHGIDALQSVKDVVITGGEPLLNYDEPNFYKMVECLLKRNKRITFETNATVAVDFEKYPAYKEAIFALSIKLSNSKEKKHKRIKPEVIDSYITNAKESFFKFTIDKQLVQSTAKSEIQQICSGYDLDIYCMPVGSSQDQILQNDRAVFEFCIQNCYRYSDRLHIRVFDETKGV